MLFLGLSFFLPFQNEKPFCQPNPNRQVPEWNLLLETSQHQVRNTPSRWETVDMFRTNRSRRMSLTDKLPYWNNRDGIIFTRQKGVEFGIEFFLPTAAEVTQETRERLAALMHQIIVQVVPERHRARIIIESAPLSEKQMVKVGNNQMLDNELLRYLSEEHRYNMEANRREGQLSAWRYFFCVKMDMPMKRFGTPVPYIAGELEKIVRRAQALRSQITSVLNTGGFSARPLSSQEAFELIWRWFNPNYASAKAPTFKSVIRTPNMSKQEYTRNLNAYSNSMREQVAETDADTSHWDHIEIGDRMIQTINVIGAGEATYAGMAENLMHRLSGYHVYYVLDWFHVKQSDIRKKLNSDAASAVVATSDASFGVPDLGNSAVVGNIANTLHRLQGGEEHIYTAGMTMVLIGRNRQELEYMKETARTELSNMTGARAHAGSAQNLPQFFTNLAPLGTQDNAYMHRTFSRNAVHFMPYVGPWRGSDKPLAVFRSRMGTLTGINPQDGTLNYGMLIVGSAGSGKTFFTQMWATRVAAAGAELVIVDQKRDYESFVEALEGQFIPFSTGEVTREGLPVRINAFELPEGEVEPSEEHKLFLMAYLTALLGGQEMAPNKRAILTSAIELVYRNAVRRNVNGEVTSYNEVTFSTFTNTLRELDAVGKISLRDKPELRSIIDELALSLSNYLGNTPLGKFLDGPSTVSINNRYVYFDIAKIRDEPALTRVALLLIIKQIWQRARKDPKQIKVPIIEEIGVLFTIPEAMEFVAALYKLSRAYNLWPVGVTQEINDFRKGKGLINNTSHFIIGKVSDEEAETVVDVLGLSPASLNLIRSLGGQKGLFREYLAITVREDQKTGDVIQYFPTKTEYWMFTSAPEERARRNAAIQTFGGNILEAIKALAGVAA